MSQNAIYNEGVRRIKEEFIDKKRIEFIINFTEEKIYENNHEKMINYVINGIKSSYNLDLTKFNNKSYIKTNEKDFYMNWHCDDCAVIKHKLNYNTEKNNVKLDDKYSLYYTTLPIYTMIVYLSDYKVDFTGGEFCFVDKIIYPQKYKVLLFDSKEIHKVNKIKSGVRKVILVKFYEKN